MTKHLRIASLAAALLLILVVVSEGSAHDTWLFSNRSAVPVGTRLTLDLTSGMAFPANETAIDPARIETAMVRLAGTTSSMSRRTGKKSLKLEAILSKPGIAALWITLKPRTLDLTSSQVHEYLEEIGAPDSIRSLYPAKGPAPRWREQYSKQAKSFVVVGKATNDTSWKIPVGMSFEIVPLSDPRTISKGDVASFLVLRDGKPVANFPVGSVGANKKSARLDRTDANGIVRIKAPSSGGWMLRATDLRRPPAGTDADWESVFTTLTINVGSGKSR